MTDFRSGSLGDWDSMSYSISDDSYVTAAITGGVWMFGDSIAMRTQSNLATQLGTGGRGQTLAVHDWSGRPTTPAVDALEDWCVQFGAVPPQIIMACGTNDIFNPPVMAAQIVRAMALVAGRAQVYWKDVQCSRWQQPASVQIADQRNSGYVNAQIHDAVAEYANLHVIPWFASLASSPGRLGQYLSDGVHPKLGAGVAYHNAVVLNALPVL